MASALEHNSTLEMILWTLDEISNEGRAAILRAFHRSHCPIAREVISKNELTEAEYQFMMQCWKVNKTQLVQKAIRQEIPNELLPTAIQYVSDNRQHVSKLFAIFRERPDLFDTTK
mmetsp:Transcript_13674/g.19137  ORF Transcript_13674/g.19137 Transcript_13674/m.19137 type:complete len:116 (-) Transcript_13674:146-493(-)